MDNDHKPIIQKIAQRRYENAKAEVAVMLEKLQRLIEQEEFDAARIVAQNLARQLESTDRAANLFAKEVLT